MAELTHHDAMAAGGFLTPLHPLTPDEVRMIQGHRAVAASREKPHVNKGTVANALLISIRRLIDLGFELNPSDPMWVQLRHVLPEVD